MATLIYIAMITDVLIHMCLHTLLIYVLMYTEATIPDHNLDYNLDQVNWRQLYTPLVFVLPGLPTRKSTTSSRRLRCLGMLGHRRQTYPCNITKVLVETSQTIKMINPDVHLDVNVHVNLKCEVTRFHKPSFSTLQAKLVPARRSSSSSSNVQQQQQQ